MCNKLLVDGIVVQGYGLAGADPNNKRDGLGCIEMQARYFKREGLFDFDHYFPNGWKSATLNVKVDSAFDPLKIRHDYTFHKIQWNPNDTAETFYMTDVEICFEHKKYRAILYVIDPETKQNCYHHPQTIEIIAEPIPNIQHGDRLTLIIDTKKLRL